MKKITKLFCAIALAGAMLGCQEQEMVTNEVPNEIVGKLKKAGFDVSEGLSAYKGGYLVEYDIFLTKAQIEELAPAVSISAHAEEEHYRTTYIVTPSPRTLKVYMDPAFGTYMINAFNTAINRYKALNLTLNFQIVSTSGEADISILSFYENSNVLGYSAGFPSSAGVPATPIRLNTRYYGGTSQRADAATVIAHEIGHAIGFRHTDYMRRRYSCGSGGNEGSAGVGAVHIPGTPTGTNGAANSWMLACSNGTDRPFTSNDIIALTTVY